VRELTGDMQLTKKELAETQMIVTTPEKWDVITRKVHINALGWLTCFHVQGMCALASHLGVTKLPPVSLARGFYLAQTFPRGVQEAMPSCVRAQGGDVSIASLVKLLIIDEVHLLNDDRGPVIETLVARTQRQVRLGVSVVECVGGWANGWGWGWRFGCKFVEGGWGAGDRQFRAGLLVGADLPPSPRSCACAIASGGGKPGHDPHRGPQRHAAQLQGRGRLSERQPNHG